MTEPRDPPTGTLAEEALRLVETLGLLAGAHTSGHAHAESDGGPGEPRAAGSSWADVGSAAECRVCPVCRVIAGVRQLRPEVLQHLVAAGEELLAAAREFAASAGTAPAGATPPPEPGESPPRPPERRPEHIELD